MSDALLKIENLSAAYYDRNVISGISFDIQPGEIVCIVGESGSGKSSLVKAIHGMSGLRITEGNVRFGGRDIADLGPKERRGLMGPEIGLIPQDPGASFNPIRRYDVQFREALSAHDREYSADEIARILAEIGLDEGDRLLRSRPYELSGGMNQRIAIAAAMMFEPRLLMCDEATSALDVTTAGAVVDQLLRARKQNGTAILMVTHHLGIAQRMADNIGIMKSGRIVEYGSAGKIFSSPEDEYTRNLIRDVPRLRR